MAAILTFSLLFLSLAFTSYAGITSPYVRKLQASVDMPIDKFPKPAGDNAPEQVHITQGDLTGKGVIFSWVTPKEPYPNYVTYWPADGGGHKHTCHADTKTYKYYDYTSGFIHHATAKNLEYNTRYIYKIGNETTTVRRLSFITPPALGPDVPYTFGIIGDLGQTYDSNVTLSHYVANQNARAMLCVGDLSYADDHPNHDNRRWDTFGRFIEISAAYQPWIWTAGNHELDFAPQLHEFTPFKPYRHHKAHLLFGKYTPQYVWLENELKKVNRSETPWLIVLHSPWYNSNNYHYMEGETMRVQFESWFVKNKVDIVFAGHVHSYERTERISNVRYNITNRLSTPTKDPSAPIYITIGDGGNIEGLANSFSEPQPSYSAYREASYGHAILDIKNRTHVHYTWHRNQDDVASVAADSLWIFNRFWYPEEECPYATCRS